MEQVPGQFILEYSYDPGASAPERYDAALDVIIQLILADLPEDNPGHPTSEPTEGVP